MKEREERQAKQLKDIHAILAAFDQGMWSGVVKMLEKKIERYKNQREGSFWSLNETQTKTLKAREEELEAVIQMPKVLMGSYEGLKKENKKLNDDIRNYGHLLKKAGL